MTHLLDTNVCIQVMRGVGGVHAKMEQRPRDSFALSVVSYFELVVGVRKAARSAEEDARLQRLLAAIPRLHFGEHAADEAADIRAHLEAKGRGIGPYDTLIAGHARSLGLVLVTGNTDEFSRVPRLEIEDWTKA